MDNETYMTGTLEFQIQRILKDSFTDEDKVNALTMLFRERERLRSGGAANENQALKTEMDQIYTMTDIRVIADGEESRGMNTITTIVNVMFNRYEGE